MPTPLFNALQGTIWVGQGKSSLAHLVTYKKSLASRAAFCGINVDGRVLSLQVGGYSMQPCLYCIGLMWAKMVNRYNLSGGGK